MSNSAQDRSFLTLAFCLRVCWEERRDGKGVNGYQKYSYYLIISSKTGLEYDLIFFTLANVVYVDYDNTSAYRNIKLRNFLLRYQVKVIQG